MIVDVDKEIYKNCIEYLPPRVMSKLFPLSDTIPDSEYVQFNTEHMESQDKVDTLLKHTAEYYSSSHLNLVRYIYSIVVVVCGIAMIATPVSVSTGIAVIVVQLAFILLVESHLNTSKLLFKEKRKYAVAQLSALRMEWLKQLLKIMNDAQDENIEDLAAIRREWSTRSDEYNDRIATLEDNLESLTNRYCMLFEHISIVNPEVAREHMGLVSETSGQVKVYTLMNTTKH